MSKKICFILVVAILMASLGTLSAYAEGDSPMPSVYAENKTVTAGNTFEIVVRASDFNSVGALDLYAFYDPEIFTLVSASTLSFASGAQTTINTGVAGEANFSMVSATGISGSGSLWSIYFRVNQSTAAGVYPITLAAGNAFSAALDPIDISVSSPRITVNSVIQEQKHLYFYSHGSSPTLYSGDTVTVSFATNNLYDLSSADFELEYDESLLRFESVTLGYKLTSASNAIYSVNSKTPGYVKLSYVATDGVSGSLYPMLSATFTVIASEATNTQVELNVSSIYDENLNTMIGSTAQYGLTIGEIVETPSLPEITVSGFEGTEDAFSVSVQAPGSTSLAAVDLVFTFNPEQIICTNVSKTSQDCFIVYNIDNENGTIKLSFICEDGISSDTEIAQISFSTQNLIGGNVKLNVSGKNAVNANYESISFSYESPTFICHKLVSATCTTPQACSICGKEYAPSLGHAEVYHESKDPTCIDIGWEAYYSCSRCEWSTYAEIPALGHTPVIDSYVEPTCTETGLTEGSHCGVCQQVLVSQESISALGHRVLVDGRIWVDSINYENDSTYPFILENGIYSSSNKANSSDSYFTITALYDCTLNISYAVSSEQNYDKLIIRRNGSTIVEISGLVDWNSKTVNLSVGDVVTINYHKDVSVASNQDTGWFTFSCEQTQIGTLVPAPAEDAEATCTEAVVCHYCQTVVKDALGHDINDWTETQAPTCTENGIERGDCSRCDYYEIREVNATGHTYDTVIVAPTCTDRGFTTYTCHCGDSYVDSYVGALDHNFSSWTETTAPTCTENGAEKRDCSRCDYYETREIKATGHSYDAVITLPTCTNRGYTTHTCHCGDSYVDSYVGALDHNFGSWTETKAPTCTENGAERRDCSRCDYYETKSINATGHTYSAVITTPTCTERGFTTHTCHCGDSYVDTYTAALGHNLGDWTETKAPTCTENGAERRDCSRCDYYESRTVVANGHTSSDWIIDAEATYESDGIKHKECMICFAILEESFIPMLTHSYESTVVLPTCTEQGYTVHTCSDCGDTYVDDYVDALGHAFDTWIQIKDPTCTEKGTDRRDCSVCEYYDTRDIEIIAHSYSAVVTNPTCTDRGYTTYTCNCGDSYVDSYVNALDHNLSAWIETKAPTCTEKGAERRDCTRCDYYETRTVNATGHAYDAVITSPTCTDRGYTTHTCHCGDSYVDSYVSALDHNFGSWTETKAPTCTETGTERRDCSRCDYYETKSISATGHSYSIVSTDPTCTERGYTTHTCSKCGNAYVDNYISAIGHSFGTWYETKAPTCTEEGIDERECSACYTKETRTIVANGHKNSTSVVENRIEPNCITDGSYDSVVYCSVCADELSRTNMLVDNLGHIYITDTGITPTCTESGLTEGSHCDRCNEILVAQEVIPSIGHKYGEWIEITAPGKDTKGSESRYCEKCDYCETREIAPLGYVNDFIDAVNSITEKQSLEDTFSELHTALVLYSKLSEDEKHSVSDSFAILQSAIEDYNNEAKLVNNELANATEVAFAPITANFAFLAALWFILKKKFKV